MGLEIDAAALLFPIAEARGLGSRSAADFLAWPNAACGSVFGLRAPLRAGDLSRHLGIGQGWGHTHQVCQNSLAGTTGNFGKPTPTSMEKACNSVLLADLGALRVRGP